MKRVYIVGNIHMESTINEKRFTLFREGLMERTKGMSKMSKEESRETEENAFLKDYG